MHPCTAATGDRIIRTDLAVSIIHESNIDNLCAPLHPYFFFRD